jgi:hypothetical protein
MKQRKPKPIRFDVHHDTNGIIAATMALQAYWQALRNPKATEAEQNAARKALADLVELHATWELSTAGRAVSLGKNKRGGDVTDSGKPVGMAWTIARSPDSSERGKLWADGDFDTAGPRCFRS